jgi:glucokinase
MKAPLLGIDLGGTKTSVCIGDVHGNFCSRQRMPSAASEGPRAWWQRTQKLITGSLRSAEVEFAELAAVGLAAPGPLSTGSGTLLAPPNMPGWVDVPIVTMLQDFLHCPVFLENDANACALAELYFGEFRDVQHLVYLTASTGMGAGIVSNGVVIQGVCDHGGEVGHFVLDADGPECPCGQRGCFEIFCGGKNVADRLRSRIGELGVRTAVLDHAQGDLERVDFACLLQAVREQDAFALQAFEEFTDRLAQGIGVLLMTVNPQVVLLGTIAIHAGELLLEPLRRKLPRYAWAPAVKSCTLAASTLGERIGDLSALAVARAGLDQR